MPESATSLDVTSDPGEIPTRPPISILGVRRRYWEITHGWAVPTSSQDNATIDTPGRVA